GLKVTEDGAFLRVEDTGGRAVRPGPQKDTTGGPELRLFVYRLKHARATKLAGTLQAIFGGPAARQLAEAAPAGPPMLSQELRQQQVPPTEVAQPPQVSVQLGPTRTP